MQYFLLFLNSERVQTQSCPTTNHANHCLHEYSLGVLRQTKNILRRGGWKHIPNIALSNWRAIWAMGTEKNMMTSSNGNIFRVTGHLCGEFTGPRLIPAQRPVTRSFDVFFYLRLNKQLRKQSWGWWFETPSRQLWHHCNEQSDVGIKVMQITLFSFEHLWKIWISWRDQPLIELQKFM